MSEISLLPCPFCGSKAALVTDPDGIKDTEGRLWAFSVTCGRCCASSGLCWSEEMASKSWNNRKPMERIVDQLEEERGIAFLTLANTSDIPDMVYEKVSQYLDKAIEIVKKGSTE